jgi:peptidoglycan/xylan/chitin deacetylase (PgdA/CDA1 family)
VNGSWRDTTVGVVGEAPGWWRVLGQLGVPARQARPGEDAILVVEGSPEGEVMSALQRGAVVVASGVTGGGPLGPGTLMAISQVAPSAQAPVVVTPCLAWVYPAAGTGLVRRHEERLVKGDHEPGRYALLHERSVGAGTLIATGVPLTQLLTAVGDRLRAVGPCTTVTERIAAVDTAGVEELLRGMVTRAYRRADLPMVRAATFPDRARSVSILRVDVDGDPDGGLPRLLAAAERHDVPLSIFLNEQHTVGHHIPAIPMQHEVGQHGSVHNLFDDVDRNLANLQAGERWSQAVTGRTIRSFVGPRGLWNEALDRAIAQTGYDYSSEFSLAVDGLPFRTAAGVLQVPVHPYSPERAVVQAREEGRPVPSPTEIVDHYRATFMRHLCLGRPVHVYGHATELGKVADEVIGEIARLADRARVPHLTIGGFASWWAARERCGLRSRVHRRSGRVEVVFDGDPVVLADELPSRFSLGSIADHTLRIVASVPSMRG